MYPDLLPPNATPLERSLASATGRLTDVPVEIERVWRSGECPSELLPWLAWALSVDVWDDGWSDERKRRVIAASFDLHRLKGTEAGLRRHVQLVDAKVGQVITPPQGAFASRGLSKGEVDAWLRTMPQIRVYLANEFGSGQGLSFTERSFADHAFCGFDTGRALLGRAARLWDRGDETRLQIADVSTEREERIGARVERVSIPGDAGPGAFVGRFADHHFASFAAKQAQTVTYRLDVNYEHRLSSLFLRSAAPSLDPVDVTSERISERGHAGGNAFIRRFEGNVFAGEDRAPWMMYDRIVLHDPARAAVKIPAWSFAGTARLGIPKFTAKAIVDLRGTVHRSAAVVGRFVGGVFVLPPDEKAQANVRMAIRSSKAIRDRILITHKLTRPRTFEDGVPLDGSFRFGSRVPFRL